MTGPNAEPQAEVLNPQQKLRWCLDNLGQRITTIGIGEPAADAGNVREWADSSLGMIPGSVQAQVELLYGAAKQVADTYDNQTARAFFTK